jgi:hypothetical protein
VAEWTVYSTDRKEALMSQDRETIRTGDTHRVVWSTQTGEAPRVTRRMPSPKQVAPFIGRNRDDRGAVNWWVIVAAVVVGSLIGLWFSPGRGVEQYPPVSSTNGGFDVDVNNGANTYLSVAVGGTEAHVAGAAEHVVNVEPYGGCDEAYRYPDTPGYRLCIGARNYDAGWRYPSPRLVRVLNQHYGQVGIDEPWTECLVLKGDTTWIECPDGSRYTS